MKISIKKRNYKLLIKLATVAFLTLGTSTVIQNVQKTSSTLNQTAQAAKTKKYKNKFKKKKHYSIRKNLKHRKINKKKTRRKKRQHYLRYKFHWYSSKRQRLFLHWRYPYTERCIDIIDNHRAEWSSLVGSDLREIDSSIEQDSTHTSL